jgi:hypothetical protein
LANSPHNEIRHLEHISGRMVPATLAWHPANPADGPETLKDLWRPILRMRGEVHSNVEY